MNFERIRRCLDAVAELNKDEAVVFMRYLLDTYGFDVAAGVLRMASARMEEAHAGLCNVKTEYAATLALDDYSQPAFKARKLRAILHSRIFHGAKVERALQAEFNALCKDPAVTSYLQTVTFSGD